jgi:hypothetical protein
LQHFAIRLVYFAVQNSRADKRADGD